MAKELLLVHLIGIGFLFLYLGFDLKAMIEENMLHSVSHIDPSRMNPYAGYYGLSLNYATGAFLALITSFIVDIIGAKWSMVLSGFIFTIHMAFFMFLNSYVYYIVSAIMGLGNSLSWTGQGVYLREITTKNNYLRNSAICWAVNLISLPVGGLLLLLLEYFIGDELMDYMPISTIRIIMCIFLGASFISFMLFCSLPNNSGPLKSFNKKNLIDALKKNVTMIKDRKIQLLIPCFFFIGYETGYWVAIYPTCLIFLKTLNLGSAIKVTAFYTIACGLGQILMSLIISLISNKFVKNGYKYSIILAGIIHFIAFTLVFFCIPPESKYMLTTKENYLPANTFTVILISFLFGAGDSAWNSIRTGICTSQFKNETSQAISLSRLFQSLGCSLSFLLGPLLNLYIEMAGLIILLIVTFISFLYLNHNYLVHTLVSEDEKKNNKKKEIIYKIESDITFKNIVL
ncbi:UNC93-like protein MFSD11 [Strongyloides ratti]|uniref:UNC93-like protein MFSD11 n=1 Tax=Strongyloides ratti TaxID=34506 RepID=A0A090KP65_STRRB|nr:UNC93-like protein MFSD11 [Strongyloides ratti]CEF59393.1 UNC93-like protein MFSD11 [Strongyloides ratti]